MSKRVCNKKNDEDSTAIFFESSFDTAADDKPVDD